MMISVRYVNFPKPGGKYGSLKLADGSLIMCPPDLLRGFRAGQSYEVATKQQTWGQGTDQEREVTIVSGGPFQGRQQGLQQGGGMAGYGGANRSAGSVRPNTGFVPRVVQGGGGQQGYQLRKHPEEQRLIFIQGIVQQAMGSGKHAISEMSVVAQAADLIYQQLTKPKPVEPEPKPMPDEPPPPAPNDYPGAG